MRVNWIVVFKMDDNPVEVTPFEDEELARELYDQIRINWSEVYLCEVIDGPAV